MSGKDIWTTDEGRQMCRHGGLSHSLNTSCPDEWEGLICNHCGKDVDPHPTVDVSHTDRLALCQERAIKWQRVEPGTVIPAGQPYRIEYTEDHRSQPKASEFLTDEPFRVTGSRYPVFVDSSWKPPLVLPTEPGSVILAGTETDAVNVPMFLLDRDCVSGVLDRFWVDVTGLHWDESEIVSARTVYDAGAAQ